ncbi:hypothetical protein HK097_003456 [Rhizophlyctis rosea]|uniref:NADP-dependent oxidoreductase domain-containing protein n=1 Tax=Rhizophlyctis rosea TaxID=64517 RepID=A0AAD5WZK9_9FUNG|nr:hypothetical protein HK097_003456 [Rhizophlyctis rosea]
MSHPTIVYGAASFWNPSDIEYAKVVLPALERLGIKHIDTARGYGESEAILGQLGAPEKFIIDTKVPGFAPKTQTKEKVFAAEKASFGALKTNQIDVYYLHSPDTETPISETLAAINEIYKSGKFKRFGLSNFSPEQVQAVYDHAKQNNYVLPTVYQGNYNPVSRHIEEDLFPLLRKLNIAFYVYSPIAGGFLSKSVDEIKAGGSGRWDPNSNLGKMYHALYNRPKVLEGLQEWSAIAEAAGIPRAELAYRFVAYHSAVRAELGDAVIIGASKIEQLEQTVKGFKNGPLPKEVVERVDSIWEKVKGDAPRDNYELVKP